MIVYNVDRRWFSDKNMADKYRVGLGLKPAALAKVTVEGRDDLSALLNALCVVGTPASVSGPTPDAALDAFTKLSALVDRAFVAPGTNVPDCVPLFLLDPGERERVAADRLARGAK